MYMLWNPGADHVIQRWFDSERRQRPRRVEEGCGGEARMCRETEGKTRPMSSCVNI